MQTYPPPLHNIMFEDEESHEKEFKHEAEVSMGTEIAEMDILNIQALAE